MDIVKRGLNPIQYYKTWRDERHVISERAYWQNCQSANGAVH